MKQRLGIVEKAHEVTWSSRTSRIKVPRARLPDGDRIYAVGDIHGRLDLLDEIIARIDADMAMHPASNTIRIFLGDYIDRVPNSKGVLDRLVSYCVAQPTVCLMGNHEAYLREFLERPEILSIWRRYGGIETLRSYGLAPKWVSDTQEERKLAAEFDRLLPPSHREFLIICGDFFFVHAGVRPGICLTKQSEDDLLCIREDFLLCQVDFAKVIVHGHTPVLEPDVRPNRINIDTGAHATGRLTCLALEGDEVSFI